MSLSRIVRLTAQTPAPYAFFIWTLINFGLLGEVVLQFFASGSELIVDHIGWRFVGTAVLNAVFVHLYGSGHYVLAFIVSLFLASVISHVCASAPARTPLIGQTGACALATWVPR